MVLIVYHIDKQQFYVILLVDQAMHLYDNHLYYQVHSHRNDQQVIFVLNEVLDLYVKIKVNIKNI
jgi:hypothetical protein